MSQRSLSDGGRTERLSTPAWIVMPVCEPTLLRNTMLHFEHIEGNARCSLSARIDDAARLDRRWGAEWGYVFKRCASAYRPLPCTWVPPRCRGVPFEGYRQNVMSPPDAKLVPD